MPFVLPNIHIELARVPNPGEGAVVDADDDHLREHRPRTANRDAKHHGDEPAGDEGRARDGAPGDRGYSRGGDAPEPRGGAARRAARRRRARPPPRRGGPLLGHDRLPDQGSEPFLRGPRPRRAPPAGDQPSAGHGQRPGGLRRRHPVAGDRRRTRGPPRLRRDRCRRPGHAAAGPVGGRVVAVSDGSGVQSAQAAWHFVVESPAGDPAGACGVARVVPDRGGAHDARAGGARAARPGPRRPASQDRGLRPAGAGDHPGATRPQG